MTTPPYSQRLQERWRRWWGGRRPSTRWHRLRELTTRVDEEADLDTWRCCPDWHRRLSNKLNGHAFARRCGARTVRNLWLGRRPAAIPWNELPEAFVVKPLWGEMSKGVVVLAGGTNHIDGEPMTREDLRRELIRGGRVRWIPLVVEDACPRPDGTLGRVPEYKLHVFGDRVEGITHGVFGEKNQGFFSPDWEPFPDRMVARFEPAQHLPPPPGLAEMKRQAQRIGAAVDDYCRLDFFESDDGPVFGEFSMVPYRGLGITPFADEYLGECWQRMLERRGDAPA